MEKLTLYRKRIIPQECILLNDVIVFQSNDIIVTKWNALNPKIDLHHGCSCYYLKEGYKVSKFYRQDNTLLYWYCDIVDYEYQKDSNTLIVTDLLADVIIYPSAMVRVMDLDELAIALEKKLIDEATLRRSLQQLHNLLDIIYNDKFDHIQRQFKNLGL